MLTPYTVLKDTPTKLMQLLPFLLPFIRKAKVSMIPNNIHIFHFNIMEILIFFSYKKKVKLYFLYVEI